jgi:hypothetical protein
MLVKNFKHCPGISQKDIQEGIFDFRDWVYFQVLSTCERTDFIEQKNPSFEKFRFRNMLKNTHLETVRFRSESQHIQATNQEILEDTQMKSLKSYLSAI